MTEETENLVLIQLRDIRAKLETFEARFDKIDKDHDTFRFQLTHTFGIAGIANTQAYRADEKADDAPTLHQRMNEYMAEAERRVRRLEDASKSN